MVPVRGWRWCVVLFLVSVGPLAAAEPFQETVLPFVKTYCVSCHNAQKASAELNLAQFDSAAKVIQDFRAWEHVLTFVRKEEMPPAKAKQPTAKERADVLAALEGLLLAEAKKFAGDPGVVPPRRLSNAEYDYSVEDLTGFPLRPAKAFPIDPSSGEGFNNTGEALVMSPALFKKYYAAAEYVADHAVLSRTGLKFAPHPVVNFADRVKYAESAVLRFYEQHAIDYERYLKGVWQHQHAQLALADIARDQRLSLKYLQALATVLLDTKEKDAHVVGWLRSRWRLVPPTGDVSGPLRVLANEIQQLSKILCVKESEAIVANAGNGPIEHLARRRTTAANRDQFNNAGLNSLKLEQEFKNIGEQESIKVTLRLVPLGETKAEGRVLVKGMFTTNSATMDGQKFWSLKRLLLEFAPDVHDKLTFGNGPKNEPNWLLLDAPTTLELTIPVKAFFFKDVKKASVTFAAECEYDRTTPTATGVQLGDLSTLRRPLISDKHPIAKEYATSAATFCRLFPNRFFYVDNTRGLSAGFHLIEGFFRDDQPLCRSVLNEAENAELNYLWDELAFVTGIAEKMLRGFVFFERSERNFLKHPDFDAFKEEDPNLTRDDVLAKFQDVYLQRSRVKATGDELAKHPITIFFTDLRQALQHRTAQTQANEARYIKDIHAFAAKAYRRPLTPTETQKLEQFYQKLARDPEHGIEAAVRASLVRVLVSPHFCFHVRTPPRETTPLSDLELATRLSYFLWSSLPDAELLALAQQGKLRDEATLKAQVQRMIRDPKISRFTGEFFGQWLGYRDFLNQESVNRQAFPLFDDALKQAMFEEPTRLATYLLQEKQPITALLNGDSTFVNAKLAQHYGFPYRGTGDWERVTGLHEKGRAGVLGMGVLLTKNSQPLRTSPVKRGFWVVHKLLGEHIPPPPPDVAVLPAKETDTNGKTIRQLLAMHTEDARCARCHQRFDGMGLAMEGFDPIGKARTKDLSGRPIDNVVQLPTGKDAKGLPALADYLATHRKTDFTKTLCQKLLGYALGRSVQLSDQPLLNTLQADLTTNNEQLSILLERVVLSPAFRNHRAAPPQEPQGSKP